jgi:hypothetical protein
VGCRKLLLRATPTAVAATNTKAEISAHATAYSSYDLYNSDKYSSTSHRPALASAGLGSPVGEPSPVPPTQAQHLVNTYSQSTTAQRHRKHRNHYLPKALQQWVLISGYGYTTDIVPEIHTLHHSIATGPHQIVPPTPASKLHPVSTHLDLVLKHGAQHSARGGPVLLVYLVQAGLDLADLLWNTSTGKYGVNHCTSTRWVYHHHSLSQRDDVKHVLPWSQDINCGDVSALHTAEKAIRLRTNEDSPQAFATHVTYSNTYSPQPQQT